MKLSKINFASLALAAILSTGTIACTEVAPATVETPVPEVVSPAPVVVQPVPVVVVPVVPAYIGLRPRYRDSYGYAESSVRLNARLSFRR